MVLLPGILRIAAALLVLFVLYGAAHYFLEEGIFLYVVLAAVVVGVGLRYVEQNPTVSLKQPDYSSVSNESGAKAPVMTEAAPAIPSGGYISGSWANKFIRNGMASESYELDSTLYNCSGFTLEYEVYEVTRGKLKSGSQFKVFVRTTDGDWVSVKTFKLKDNKATLDLRFDKKMDVESVAVVCYQEGNLGYSFGLAVRDAV